MSEIDERIWSGLSDDALLAQQKKENKSKIYDSVIVGFLIGVALYSIYNHGFGLLTFLPLVYLPIAGKNQKKRAALKKIIDERKLDVS